MQMDLKYLFLPLQIHTELIKKNYRSPQGIGPNSLDLSKSKRIKRNKRKRKEKILHTTESTDKSPFLIVLIHLTRAETQDVYCKNNKAGTEVRV